MVVKDQRGTVARLAELMAGYDIHLASLEQESHKETGLSSLVITVDPISEPVMRKVVDAVAKFDFVTQPVLVLRME